MTLPNTETFKPLSTAATTTARDEFRVTVVANPEETRPFLSLEQHFPAKATAKAAGQKSCEPRVSVQKDGDRISHIRVQCSCGQVMDIACVYDEPGTNA